MTEANGKTLEFYTNVLSWEKCCTIFDGPNGGDR